MDASHIYIVTGVSTGIGSGIARALLEKGFGVFGSVRVAGASQNLKEHANENFQELVFDVRDTEAIQIARQTVETAIADRRIQGIINNAGVAYAGPLEHIPMEEMRSMIEVNVLGLLEVTRTFLPLLETPGAKIFNMGSVSGLFSNPFLGGYAASKFALEAVTDAMRREFKVHGIQVCVLEPGPIDTPIWGKQSYEELRKRYQATRYAEPLDRFNEQINAAVKTALPVDAVAQTILKLVDAKKLPARKIVANNAWFYGLLKMLPTTIIDYLVYRSLSIATKLN
ncbi:MAG: SDR family NAD(P)-dependent oxidoreductase [Verrucomicrobiota bacterium]